MTVPMRVHANPSPLPKEAPAALESIPEGAWEYEVDFDELTPPARTTPGIAPAAKALPPDKQKHFDVGFALGRYLGPVGLILSIVLGAGKEAFDFVTRTGTPELADFTVTVRGGWQGLLSRFA